MRNKKYIRFGEIPTNEKSAIWKGEECVGYENGVSVYEAHESMNGILIPVIPYPINEESWNDYTWHMQYFRGRKYIVSGDFVGYGSNNEPLLKNVDIIEEITYSFRDKKKDQS